MRGTERKSRETERKRQRHKQRYKVWKQIKTKKDKFQKIVTDRQMGSKKRKLEKRKMMEGEGIRHGLRNPSCALAYPASQSPGRGWDWWCWVQWRWRRCGWTGSGTAAWPPGCGAAACFSECPDRPAQGPLSNGQKSEGKNKWVCFLITKEVWSELSIKWEHKIVWVLCLLYANWYTF